MLGKVTYVVHLEVELQKQNQREQQQQSDKIDIIHETEISCSPNKVVKDMEVGDANRVIHTGSDPGYTIIYE